ncbi:MAG TPA: hypothetical protein VFP95_03465 [Gammaproteobacteria bacterium]|nr:hypothetical protein [Gammaproteobacteria bacterium]
MRISLLGFSLVFFCLFCLPVAAVETTMTPVERTENWELHTSDDGIYNRDIYVAIGAIADFGTVYGPNGEYLLVPGDNWTFQWQDQATGNIVVQASYTYLGTVDGQDHCWSDGHCATHGALYSGWTERCQLEDKRYVLRLLANDTLVGEYDFRPSRFTPKIIATIYDDQIEPRRLEKEGPEYAPEYTDITVAVQDNLGCGIFLQGATVTMTSTIVSGSNEHDHIPYGARGTGRFESLGYSSEVDPNTPKTQGTEIEGQTNSDGIFKARYHAQDLAGIDIITMQPSREHTDTLPPRIGDRLERRITVGFQGFQEITTSNTPVIFVDGGTCPGHGQLPHWFTLEALQGVQAVAQIYYETIGNKLSLNDASLPLGGLIDNSYGGGRASKCHVSHRQGIDIDINKVDSGGALLRDVYNDNGELVAQCTTHAVKGVDICLDRYLNGLFYHEAFDRIKEGGSIHYRLEN